MARMVWKGNNVSHFLKINEDAEPVPVGGVVNLTQAQIDSLAAIGHAFEDAPTEKKDPPKDPPKP